MRSQEKRTPGDPDECARRLREVCAHVEGFGQVRMRVYGWEPCQKLLTSLELFAVEVMAKLAHLV